MSMVCESRGGCRGLERWLTAALFLGLFVYAWKGIQSHLLYYGFGVFSAYPVFAWESSFLRTTFRTPGGQLDALASLLAQAYRDPLLGALVIVAGLGVLFVGIRRLLHVVQGDRLRDLAWVPVILALMVYSRYDNPLPILLAVALSVWMAVLYNAVGMKPLPIRLGVLVLLFVLTYYLAGASALVFACVVCLTEVLGQRGIIIAVVRGDKARPGRRQKSARRGKDAGALRRWSADDRLRTMVRLFVVAVVVVSCMLLSRNHLRYERALHCYATHRDWDRVIALAHHMRGRCAFTPSGIFDINRALAHRGCLGNELCAYPQDETKTLFLSFDHMAGRFQHAKLLELYLDLGCPNAAEKNAYELLDNEGPSPHVLEALVRIHLAKGQTESARIALQALRKYAGGRACGQRWEDIVADPNRAGSDPLVQTWRRVCGRVDYAVGGISFEPMLKRLLADTPDHRLAFEYLLAHYLLKHQRAELVNCLPLLRPLGYNQLPRQVAEAVLVHALETRTSPQAYGRTIEPDVQSQFREMTAIVKSARGDNQAAFNALAPRYGGTYTFYSMFNVCGAK